MKNNTVKKGLMPYVIMFIFIIGCLFIINNMKNKVNEFTYDELITAFDKYLDDSDDFDSYD